MLGKQGCIHCLRLSTWPAWTVRIPTAKRKEKLVTEKGAEIESSALLSRQLYTALASKMPSEASCRHTSSVLRIKTLRTYVSCLSQVCLSIDHPQKVLIMGEAMDLGTCKAKKKNGEPCTQTVNLVGLKSFRICL